MKGLEVHHMKPRSRLGGDVTHNLITLCVSCHWKRHDGTRSVKLVQEPGSVNLRDTAKQPDSGERSRLLDRRFVQR